MTSTDFLQNQKFFSSKQRYKRQHYGLHTKKCKKTDMHNYSFAQLRTMFHLWYHLVLYMHILLTPPLLCSTCQAKGKREDSCWKSQTQLDTLQKLPQELNVLPSFLVVFFTGSTWDFTDFAVFTVSEYTVQKYNENIFQLKGGAVFP